jgi:DNA-directed RNA polymerase specialized sigma24 family protein
MIRKPPTQEAFDKLLEWLDPDRERAAEKYQKIHTRLIGIFSNHGCADPEKLADETIDRVIAKMDSLSVNYEGEPTRYFYGVARNILKEDLKRRNTHEPLAEHQQISTTKRNITVSTSVWRNCRRRANRSFWLITRTKGWRKFGGAKGLLKNWVLV